MNLDGELASIELFDQHPFETPPGPPRRIGRVLRWRRDARSDLGLSLRSALSCAEASGGRAFSPKEETLRHGPIGHRIEIHLTRGFETFGSSWQNSFIDSLLAMLDLPGRPARFFPGEGSLEEQIRLLLSEGEARLLEASSPTAPGARAPRGL